MQVFTQMQRRVLLEAASSSVTVLRPAGWNATGDDGAEALGKWRRAGHVYRGMTEREYDATVGRREPIHSTGRHSLAGEGTNFADDPGDAESYVNFGRDDPRKTGKPNYLVEVKLTDAMKRWPDGYIKSSEPVLYASVTRVWKMFVQGDEVVAQQIK